MTEGIVNDLSTDQLAVVVELQRAELNRLLAEQRRLNDRVDKLLALQEREQVLRQQMQASLDHLGSQGNGSVLTDPAEDVPLLTDRPNRTEQRFHAMRAKVEQLVITLERQLSR